MEIMILQIAISYADVENVHGPVNSEAGLKVYSIVESKPVSKTFRFLQNLICRREPERGCQRIQGQILVPFCITRSGVPVNKDLSSSSYEFVPVFSTTYVLFGKSR